MEPEDLYNAVLGALTDHARKQEQETPSISSGMLPVEPFDAETDDNVRVRVVGIVSNPASETLDFVVLKTLNGGEIIPTTEGSVWAIEPAAAG